MADTKRNQLKVLHLEKEKLEKEIAFIHNELMKPAGKDNKPVGIKGNLIDREGFPRADIDIHGIRTLRNRYACLQTDHKSLMKNIEDLLKEVMSLPFDATNAKTPVSRLEVEDPFIELIPILQVEAVDKKSPAEKCGLQQGDIILKFGSLLYDKTRTKSEILAEVVRVVGHNVNSKLDIVIERNLEEIVIELTPCQWEGRGFLGCKLVPL